MCGFCGFTGNDPGGLIHQMMDRLAHRGPDSSGVFSGGGCTLGFKRLRTSGSEDGSQPLFNEDHSLALVFDGEIYNYQELRLSLIQRGHTFSAPAEAEVVLHLFEEYGTALPVHLRGTFAFVLYDTETRSLFCARDPFGVKPFYYTHVNGTFLFGSEIKCFLAYPSFNPLLNETALAHYLTFQYSVLQETFFKGVYKLPPGHFLKIEKDEFQLSRYFTPVFTPAEVSLEEAVEAIDNAVLDSAAKHVAADAEIGSFLSSGVDSGYVAACIAKHKRIKTFTVGFDYEKYNETTFAGELSEKLGMENHSRIITAEEFWGHLPKIQYYMDEPLADPSAAALYFVSREAAKHVKIVLSGEGADELFGGYNIYREPLDLRLYAGLPLGLRKNLSFLAQKIPFAFKGKGFLIRGAKTVGERFIGNAYIFTAAEREILLKENPAAGISPMELTRPYYEQVRHEDDTTKMQYIDLHFWMPGDILLKADKMSMAHSLEIRLPFLDREVFRCASFLPAAYRINKKGTKYAFRLAAARHLPETAAKRRKLGFPVPIRIWLRQEAYYNRVKNYFTGAAAEKYFRRDKLIELLDAHYKKKKDNSRKIWTVYMFLLWYEQYFGENGNVF